MRKLIVIVVMVLFCCMVTATSIHAQTIKIQGTLRSATDSSVLQGASVVIKGKTGGSITNTTGGYVIYAPPDATLVFSYIGFISKEVIVRDQKKIDVLLQPAAENQLGDVAVTTALGIKKEQKALGYSVQQVNGATLEKVKSSTAVGALVGKVAGLNIKNTTDLFRNPGISLRGESPLIVIDGIPDPNADPYKINADDIENITVLKGTAAGALYGAIGIHGAILYTTKKGARGQLSVTLNSSTMFQAGYTRIPKVQHTYGGGDQGKYAYIDGSGGGLEGGGWIWGPKLDQKDANTESGFVELPQYNSPYDPDKTYSVTYADGSTYSGHYKPLPWVSRGSDNIKNFFQPGILSTNSIAASVGSDKGSFRVSAAHTYQKGLVPNTSVNNSTFSIGGNYALTAKLNLDAKLTYNREYSDNYPTTGYSPQNILYNLILWIGPDVDIRDLRNYWAKDQEGIQQRNYNLSWYNNPYFQAYEYLNGYVKDNTFGQATMTYQFNKDFSLVFRNGFNAYAENTTTKVPKSYIGYGDKSLGNYSDAKTNYFDITSDLILTYKHTFSDQLNINLSAGASNAYRNSKYLYGATDGLTVPELYTLSNSINPVSASSSLEERRTASLYGTADIEALKFLYFSFTGRRDQTSTLPVENNAYFYPSAGLSAVLSDALKLPKIISFLKLRASWAKVNTGIINSSDPYSHILTYENGSKWNSVPSLYWPTSVINPILIPQTTKSGEYGLTLGLLDNRINIDATYFRNVNSNNYVQVPQSQASGYTSVLQNADIYLKKGWEFVLSGIPVKTADFKWETTLNFSNNHEWLKKATLSGNGYIGTYLKEGSRTDQIITGDYLTPDGQAIYGSDGYPASTSGTLDAGIYGYKLGYADPDWIYGFQNNFTYHNFQLSFSLDGRLGGLIYSSTNQKMWWGGTALGTVTKYRDDAIEGKNTYVGPGVVITEGSVTYDDHGNILKDTRTYAPNTTPVNYISFMQSTSGGMSNNYFYYSGTYLKLREVSLTYTFPEKWTKGICKQASVSLIGNNLFLLSKIPNVDPDAESDNLQSPSIRSMGVNLNIKF